MTKLLQTHHGHSASHQGRMAILAFALTLVVLAMIVGLTGLLLLLITGAVHAQGIPAASSVPQVHAMVAPEFPVEMIAMNREVSTAPAFPGDVFLQDGFKGDMETHEVFGGRMRARISARRSGGDESSESDMSSQEQQQQMLLLVASAVYNNQAQQAQQAQQSVNKDQLDPNGPAAPAYNDASSKPASNPVSKAVAGWGPITPINPTTPAVTNNNCPCGPNCTCFSQGYAKAMADLRRNSGMNVSTGNLACTSVNGQPCAMINGQCVAINPANCTLVAGQPCVMINGSCILLSSLQLVKPASMNGYGNAYGYSTGYGGAWSNARASRRGCAGGRCG